MRKKALSVCVDMYGCPNRCRHCWLGHMPNKAMEAGSDEWLINLFRPYYESIAFYSWLREPDFCADYRARWERDKAISVNALPLRFELASFWRLVRDPDYVNFLKEVGTKCVQLTFFGLEAMTDRYIGREGAFRELMQATDILLKNGISPRWQCFINEENKDEIVRLLELSHEMRLSERCEEIGGSFKFFVHEGSCDGENLKLYPIRIAKEHIPAELIPYHLNYGELFSEAELCERLAGDDSHVALPDEEDTVLYVSNGYDLYFNYEHMKPEWRIGNLKADPIEEIMRRIDEEDTFALREVKCVTVGELVKRYGDPSSPRAFEDEDYKMYLLNAYLAEEFDKGAK